MNQGGFTDLRLNGGGGEVQEGFWPSFTDIMTVVVMIFLISMVVLLVRNMELVNQLRATMEAERIAAELARATGEEKDSLSSALHRAEERVQQMQLEIMRLQEKGLRSETLIAEQLRAISGLSNERDDLAQQAAQLSLLRERLEADVEKRQSQIDAAMQELDNKQLQLNAAQRSITTLEGPEQLRNRFAESQEQADRLQRTVAEQRESLEEARQTELEVERRYLVLASDFDNLKVKYDKLVRPARSSSGRHLIEVRYWKEGGQYQVSWREGGEGAYQPIKRSQLDKVLQRLSEENEERPLRKGHLPREQRPVIQRGMGVHQSPARQLRLLLQGRRAGEEKGTLNRSGLDLIPVNLITGFLGVGKTTAIRHLLANHPADQKWAVLVNEFGEVGVDGALLAEQGVVIQEVAGGCLCCVAAPAFTTGLNRVIRQHRPDRILIEPSGLGHPAQVLDTLTGPLYAGTLEVRATLCLMDARHLSSPRHREHPEFPGPDPSGRRAGRQQGRPVQPREHCRLRGLCLPTHPRQTEDRPGRTGHRSTRPGWIWAAARAVVPPSRRPMPS